MSRAHPVRPLDLGRGPVLVDGHPICADCGDPSTVAGGRWRHTAASTPWPPRSVRPITWARLRRLGSYAEFRDRFGWAVDAVPPTSEVDWEIGLERLTRYHERPLVPVADGGNPYLDLVQALLGEPPRPPEPGLARLLDLPARRRELAARYAWSIPSEAGLDLLAGLGPLVEGGAGTGYWAALLAARGGDIVAYDRAPPGGAAANPHHPDPGTWTQVHPAATVTAIRRHRDRTLVLGWPPYDDDTAGYHAVRAYRGQRFVYIGDGPDGAAGTVRLHRELALNWHPVEQVALPSWPGVRDRLTVYRRNPIRRRHDLRDRCDECRRYAPTGAIGRCADCRARNPAAITLRYGEHRIEYPADVLAGFPAALVHALERSVHRVRD